VWPLLDVREKQIIRRKVTPAKHTLPHQLLLSLFISQQKKKKIVDFQPKYQFYIISLEM
jgi:hypothetical protein